MKPKILALQLNKFPWRTFVETPEVREHFDVERREYYDEKVNADLVFCQAWGPYRKYAPKWKIPYVIHLGGNPWADMKGAVQRSARIMLERARCVVCNSAFLYDEVKGHLPHAEVLSGGLWGLDHTIVGPMTSRFDVPVRERKYDKNKINVVFSIALYNNWCNERKWVGIPKFLEQVESVLHELRNDGMEIKLSCYGKGEEDFPYLHEWKQRWGFEYHFQHHLFDGVDQWPEALHAADVFVHPSLRDCWPRVIAEAMLCGKPVLTYDVVGNPEVGKAVLKTDPGDSEGTRTAFRALLTNEELRRTLGEEARSEALENQERHRGDYAKILKRCIGR